MRRLPIGSAQAAMAGPARARPKFWASLQTCLAHGCCATRCLLTFANRIFAVRYATKSAVPMWSGACSQLSSRRQFCSGRNHIRQAAHHDAAREGKCVITGGRHAKRFHYLSPAFHAALCGVHRIVRDSKSKRRLGRLTARVPLQQQQQVGVVQIEKRQSSNPVKTNTRACAPGPSWDKICHNEVHDHAAASRPYLCVLQ